MKTNILAFILLFFYSGFVAASASDDLKEAYKEIGNSRFSTAIPLLELALKKIESGESIPQNDILGAKLSLATAYMTTGKVNDAEALAKPLLSELKENGPRAGYAACLEVLYYIHFFKGEDPEALKKLQIL